MSATVDERVVSMQFDNAQFERGVQQTLATLNNLNNSIEKNAAQNSVAFSGLVNSLNAMDNKISHGILPTMEVVGNKFSFMGTIADQTLRNITTSVENFITRTVNGLFQVRGGLAEYELKMGSVQTILMGTGETLDTVTKKLDELNTYSDKTIYSFKDMTDNIGKFTNQGVKLDAAVNAIKGIANEAALSGANAMQASHAMYNFAQALSSGYVKLIDWKSIENSMMATVGFKDALLQTATAMGTVVKQGDKYITTTKNAQGRVSDLFNAQMGFNDSLQNQWLTNDVLTQTLEIYATDVRDLSAAEKEAYETKLKNIGMDEEQIKNFEQLGIKAADAATEIKTFSMLVDTITEAIGSGWAKTFELIFGDFNEAKALWTGIGKYLGGLIDKFSDVRNNMLEVWKAAGGRIDLLQGLVNIGNAILSVFYPIRDAFRDVFGVMDSNALIGLTKGFAGFTQTLRLTNEQMGEVRGVMTVVFTLLKNGIDFVIRFRKEIIGLYLVINFVTTLKSLLTGGLGLGSIYSLIKMIIALGIGANLLGVNLNLENMANILSKIIGVLSDLKDRIIYVFTHLNTYLKIAIDNVKKLFSIIVNFLKGLDFGKLISYGSLLLIVKAILKIKEVLVGFFSFKDAGNGLKKTLESVKEAIDSFKIGSVFNAIKDIIFTLSLLMAAFTLLTYMNTDNIKVATEAILGMMVGLAALAYAITKISDSIDLKGVIALTLAVAALSVVLIEFVGSFILISATLGILTIIFGDVNKAMDAMMTPLIVMAAYFGSVLIGILSLAAVLMVLSGVSKAVDKGAISLLKMSAALLVFGTALSIITISLTLCLGLLSILPVDDMMEKAKSLALLVMTFSASMILLAAAANILNGANILGMAVLIGVFAASMSVLAISMSFLENLSWQQIIAFIGGFAGGLSILTVVLAKFGAAASLAIPLLGAISVTMLSFGASALMVSLGVSAINLTFSLLLSTVTSFIPVLEQFIVFLITFSSKASDLAIMSETLTSIGQSLLWVAAGVGAVGAAAIIAAAGVALLSKAITAFSAALGIASVAINLFANSIRNLISVLGAPIKEAFTWGKHLTDNFAKGLSDGSGKVKVGATAVANAIKRILGHTSPVEGPLRGVTEFLWGGHLTENIANGMEAGKDNVAGASSDLGGTILSKLSEYIPGAQQIGNSIGDALGIGVENTVKGHLMNVREAVNALKSNAPLSNETKKAAQESIRNGMKQTAHDLLNPIATDMLRNSDNPISKGIDKVYQDAKKKQSEDKNKWFDIKDFLPDVDSAINKLGGGATSTAIPDLGGAGGGGTGKGSKGGGGASSAKDNAQAEKEAAEAARLHAQYMEYSTKAAKSYDMMYSGLNKTVGDTKPTERAQEAIKLLSDYLYKSSLTGSESAEDLAKAAQNTEKAFVEMYDSIKKKTMESFDFFKEFTVDSSKILKADQILKNGQTQMLSQIEVAGMWQQLALKGIDTSQLIEMTKKGTDGIAEMRSMLMMTEDQFAKYQRMLKDTSAVADFEASQAMAASALSIQINKFKEDMKVRDERMDQYKILSMTWNEVQTDNVDLAMHSYSDIEKKLQELADKYHMTVDDLRAEAANYGNTVEDQANRQLEQYNRLTKAFYQWKDIYTTEMANMKKAAEGFLNSFDKVELKTEKTADDLIKGLESRRDAYEEWIHDINDLVTQGVNQDIINQMIQKGVEGSYETVHALANASEDQIDEINELWGNMAAQSENTAQEYGRTMATNAIVGMDATFGQYFQNLPINFNFGEFIANAKPQLDAVGQLFGNGLIDGIKAQDAAVQDSAKQVAEGADNTAGKYLNQETGFQKTAMYMVGMIEGIKKYKASLMEEIEEVVDAIADLPAETWDIHSPSRLTKKYAYFFLRGFKDEFSEHGSDTVDALSSNVLDPVVGCIRDALSTAYDILTTDSDFNPTITPVLDLSNINSGRRSLSSLMTSSGFQVEASLGNINTPSSKLDSLTKLLRGNVNDQNVGGNNYNFVQNNYSPKALSRLDIYRQTKNQFAQLKGMVN